VRLQAQQFFDRRSDGQGRPIVALVVTVIAVSICNRRNQASLASDCIRPKRIRILARLARASVG
jgi:hypothetical protein